MPDPTSLTQLEIHPATPDRWNDLQALFGARGACGGCWCMYWRRTHAEFNRGKGDGNREALRRILDADEVPGLIAYAEGRPAAWIALAPRERYPRLAKSRVLKPLDDRPVWSVVCFFVAKPYRRRGLTVQLLEAAAAWAKNQGAEILEGYPVAPRQDIMPDTFAYTGLPSAFEKAGFAEAARRSPVRPIMRRRL